MEHLSDIAVFVKVVESGSFTAAAEQLELSKAAVSKYVNRLEQRLGARLLNRTTRRLTLTEAGDALFGRSVNALAELAQAEEEVAQLTGAPRGHLRITAPIYFGAVHIAPLLHRFRTLYPDITLDFDLNDRIVDLVEQGFDVGVRITQPPDSSLVARRLAPCFQVVCGSPAYFRRRGIPATPADLREHECLSYSLERSPNEWRFHTSQGRWISVNVRGSIRCNNDIVLKQAILDGLGIRQFPHFFVEQELADGRLMEVLQDYSSPPLAIYAVYATRRNLVPKVRVFVDFLAEHFAA